MNIIEVIDLTLTHSRRCNPFGILQADNGAGEFRYNFEWAHGYLIKIDFPELGFMLQRDPPEARDRHRHPHKPHKGTWEWSGDAPMEETAVLLRLALL